MKISEFTELIIRHFGFTPTEDQRNAVDCFGHFLASRSDMAVMVLKGSAGTGKTSIVASMVQTLASLRQYSPAIYPNRQTSPSAIPVGS